MYIQPVVVYNVRGILRDCENFVQYKTSSRFFFFF